MKRTIVILVLSLVGFTFAGCVTNKGSVAVIDMDNRTVDERIADNDWPVQHGVPPQGISGIEPSIWLKLLEILPGFKRTRLIAIDWTVLPCNTPQEPVSHKSDR